jgi:hydrogenase maturation protease
MAPAASGEGVVVIGYGNELRGDDGLGPWVAREIRARRQPAVQVFTVPQLTPELAEALAGARLAIFVDAAWVRDGGPLSVSRVEAAAADSSLTHFGRPRDLLGLAERVLGRAPEAWLVTVAGQEFGLREGLSAAALQHGQLARARIENMIRRSCRAEPGRE